MNTFIRNFAVLAVAVVALGIAVPVASFEQARQTAVVADSGWGPAQPKTEPVSGS
ncbi:hypothetical protein AB0M39_10090 [Streptomyces sp. NPDC051907]|uniref:hypothetical protein n=1 Tax=Streptomyces sp. NPDC051907 TaxID=3155284 RepID=UPI003431AEB7